MVVEHRPSGRHIEHHPFDTRPRRGSTPVAEHHRPGMDPYPTDFPATQLRSALVDDGQRNAGHRAAAGGGHTLDEIAEAAFQGVGVITVVTPWTTSSQVRVIDPTWANGSGESRRSPGSDRVSVAAATAANRRWSKIAPFGSPVVPLVHTTATGSVGSRSGHEPGGGPSEAPTASARCITVPVG